MRKHLILAAALLGLAGIAAAPASAQVATGVGVVGGAVVGGAPGAVVGGVIGNSLDRRPYRVVPTPRQTARALTPRRHVRHRRFYVRNGFETDGAAHTEPFLGETLTEVRFVR